MDRIEGIKAKLKEAKLVEYVTKVDKRDYINDIEHLLSLIEWVPVENPPKIWGQQVLVKLKNGHITVDEYGEIRESLVYFSSASIVVGEGFLDNDIDDIESWKYIDPSAGEAP